jgi:hypothetical protein
MMQKEFSCHLIGGRMLFALGSKHNAFFSLDDRCPKEQRL